MGREQEYKGWGRQRRNANREYAMQMWPAYVVYMVWYDMYSRVGSGPGGKAINHSERFAIFMLYVCTMLDQPKRILKESCRLQRFA